MLSDFPKIQCPFVRQTFKVNREQWSQSGNLFQLREPQVYLCVDKVNPGYEWVFDDPDTFCVEKLNGTNVKLRTEKGRLVELQNRLNVLDPLQIVKGKTFIIEGIFRAVAKGYIPADGTFAGECIGPKLQGNPYHLDYHEWYPFDKAITDLRYKSFDQHARTYDNWSTWFKDWLHSRYFIKRRGNLHGLNIPDNVFAEGVVFYNLKRKATGEQSYMAKLRRDMFPWFYEGIEIYDYVKEGRPVNAMEDDAAHARLQGVE